MSIATTTSKSLWSYNPSPTGCVLYAPLWHPTYNASKFVVPNGYTCTNEGCTWTTKGYDMVGDDDDVIITPVLAPLASSTVGTWMAWIQPDDVGSYGCILCAGDTDANEFISFYTSNGAKLFAWAKKAGAWQWNFITDDVVLANDTWVHVALVQDGTAPVLYVNGIAVAQTFSDQTDKTVWFSDLAGLDNMNIGVEKQNNASANFFNGVVGEVQICNWALPATGILHNVNTTKWRYS